MTCTYIVSSFVGPCGRDSAPGTDRCELHENDNGTCVCGHHRFPAHLAHGECVMRSVCNCPGYTGTLEAAPEHQKSKTGPDRTPELTNNGVHSGTQEDEVDLCTSCGTMKHLNADSLCGRCAPESQEDECTCGDYRRDHEKGNGPCKMPDNLTHGFKPCKRFRPAAAAPAAPQEPAGGDLLAVLARHGIRNDNDTLWFDPEIEELAAAIQALLSLEYQRGKVDGARKELKAIWEYATSHDSISTTSFAWMRLAALDADKEVK